MNSSRLNPRRWASGVALLILVTSIAWAGGLSIDDLIALKRTGFSDDEIQQEIDRTETRLEMTTWNVRKLRAAGFSQEFIDRLRAAGTPELTLDAVKSLSQQGVSEEDLIGRVAASKQRFRLTPKEALDLARARVGSAVIRALKGGALKREEVISLVRGGTGEPALNALIDAVGADFTPNATGALELVRAGVPAGIVKKLREKKAVPAPVAGWRYEHPAGRFGLTVPAGWKFKLAESKEEFGLRYVFQPERRDNPERDAPAFTVRAIPVPPQSRFAALSIEDVARQLFATMRAEKPGLRFLGAEAFEKHTLGGEEAVFFDLRRDQALLGLDHLRLSFGVARKNGFLYLVARIAPLRQFHALSDAFDECTNSLRLGRIPYAPPVKRPSYRGLVEKYGHSVVRVSGGRKGESGSGTGFIVREDGYVITNYETVWDQAKQQFDHHILVNWEAPLKRRALRAEVVAAAGPSLDTTGPIAEQGANVALLRIVGPGSFEAMPLARLQTVRVSDAVFLMGLPGVGRFAGSMRLAATRGKVVRMDQDRRGVVDAVVVDTGASQTVSGGPCIDLKTGVVIGWITSRKDFSARLADGEVPGRLGQRVPRSVVSPIRICLDEFADVLDLAAGADRDWGAADYYIHAMDLFARGAYPAAERRLTEVLRREQDHVGALMLRAACAFEQSNLEGSAEQAERVLRLKPDHYQALTLMARLHAARQDLEHATRFIDRAILARPSSAGPYLTQGQIHLSLGHYREALRDADHAAKFGNGPQADSERLAGESLYAMGRLKEGRARYQRAVKLNPVDLQALLGAARYFELEGNYRAAATEYTGIAVRLPLAPEPEEARGRCLVQQKQYGPANQAYDRAFAKCRVLKRVPPESLYEGMARLAQDINSNVRRSRVVLVGYLKTYADSPQAHARMGEFHAKTHRYPGLAYAHALIADRLSPGDEAILKRTRLIPPAALERRDVDAMVMYGYGPVALTVARAAPIGFVLDRKELAEPRTPEHPIQQVLLERQDRGQLGPAGRAGGLAIAPADEALPPPEEEKAPDEPEFELWTAPDQTLTIPVPAGFNIDDAKVREAQQAGFGFVRFYAANPKMPAEAHGLVFDPSVRTLTDAFELIQRYRATSQARMKVESRSDVHVRGMKGVYARGILQRRGGPAASFEVVLIPEPDGIRGVLYTTVPEAFESAETQRRLFLSGFKAGRRVEPGTEEAPPPPLALATFRDPSGLFTIDYPKSFVPTVQAPSGRHEEGLKYVRMKAKRPRSSAAISVFAFGVPVSTPRQALLAIQHFERSVGCAMVVTRQKYRKLGEQAGIWYSGIGTQPDGVKLAWEAFFLPLPTGVMGVVITAPLESFSQLAAEREALLGGIRIVR